MLQSKTCLTFRIYDMGSMVYIQYHGKMLKLMIVTTIFSIVVNPCYPRSNATFHSFTQLY